MTTTTRWAIYRIGLGLTCLPLAACSLLFPLDPLKKPLEGAAGASEVAGSAGLESPAGAAGVDRAAGEGGRATGGQKASAGGAAGAVGVAAAGGDTVPDASAGGATVAEGSAGAAVPAAGASTGGETAVGGKAGEAGEAGDGGGRVGGGSGGAATGASASGGAATGGGAGAGDLECSEGHHACDGECIPDGDCCTEEDCELGSTGTIGECAAGRCTYLCDEPSYRDCAGECIPAAPDGCCGDDECEAPTASCGAAHVCVDADAPTVIGISPAAGAIGVTMDESMQIDFGEPMARDSVEGALSVSNVTPSDLSFSWNAESTSVTVVPEGGWHYAEGTAADQTDPQAYLVTISDAASDQAGNQLETSYQSGFSTLRRITADLRPSTVLRYDSYQREAHDCTNTFEVGHFSSQSAKGYQYGLVGLQDALLPPTVTEIESAVLTVREHSHSSGFYEAGRIGLESLGAASYREGDTLRPAAQSDLGLLFASATSAASMDVTNTVNTYWPNEQFFRITPVNVADNVNSSAELLCTMDLTVVYLLP